jgi:hypothetical protein
MHDPKTQQLHAVTEESSEAERTQAEQDWPKFREGDVVQVRRNDLDFGSRCAFKIAEYRGNRMVLIALGAP